MPRGNSQSTYFLKSVTWPCWNKLLLTRNVCKWYQHTLLPHCVLFYGWHYLHNTSSGVWKQSKITWTMIYNHVCNVKFYFLCSSSNWGQAYKKLTYICHTLFSSHQKMTQLLGKINKLRNVFSPMRAFQVMNMDCWVINKQLVQWMNLYLWLIA